MGNERLKQRIADFQKAVYRLKEACEQEENEFIRDSVIQRFEFSFELGWKMLKLKLEAEEIEARSPKETLFKSLELGLIDNGNDWTEMHRIRNLTSHTYDETLARNVYQFVASKGLELLETLSKASGQWLEELE